MNFSEYLTARLAMPFEWGRHDCICFVVGWAELATGQDYLSTLPPWTNEDEATVAVNSVRGLKRAFNKRFKRIDPAFARDGDIALIDRTAYLFTGARIVTVGPGGLIFRDRMEATCAWSY